MCEDVRDDGLEYEPSGVNMSVVASVVYAGEAIDAWGRLGSGS